MKTLTIYCNAELPAASATVLRQNMGPHRLLLPAGGAVGVLQTGAPDPQLETADVVFGQPDVGQLMAASRLAWVQLSSAGYTRYDRDDLRAAFTGRGVALTKSSVVYDDACAQHLLAFLCAEARQLPAALDSQRGDREWPQARLRARSRLLGDQSAVIVGFGSIGRRLVELLTPLRMSLSGVRRRVIGDEPIATYGLDDPAAARAIAEADHVIDILPESPLTPHFFDAARIGSFKTGAVFYNIGRGATVDEDALHAALDSGRLAAAYLDVTSVEPLPSHHALWSAPNCFITPHTAGGHADESMRLVRHFLDNLTRFTTGQPLLDRVI